MQQAIRCDDVASMMYYIRLAGGNANTTMTDSRYTALTYCISICKKKCFDHLMSRGGNPAIRPSDGKSALWYALRYCRSDMHYLRAVMTCVDPDFVPYERDLNYPNHLRANLCREIISLIHMHPNFDADTDMTQLITAVNKMTPELTLHACSLFKYNAETIVTGAVHRREYSLVDYIINHGLDLNALKRIAIHDANATVLMMALRHDPQITSSMVDTLISNMSSTWNIRGVMKCLDIVFTVGARPSTTPLKFPISGRMTYSGRLSKFLALLHNHRVDVDGEDLFDNLKRIDIRYRDDMMSGMIGYFISINRTIEVSAENAIFLTKNIENSVEREDTVVEIYAGRIEYADTPDKKTQLLKQLVAAVKTLTAVKTLAGPRRQS